MKMSLWLFYLLWTGSADNSSTELFYMAGRLCGYWAGYPAIPVIHATASLGRSLRDSPLQVNHELETLWYTNQVIYATASLGRSLRPVFVE